MSVGTNHAFDFGDTPAPAAAPAATPPARPSLMDALLKPKAAPSPAPAPKPTRAAPAQAPVTLEAAVPVVAPRPSAQLTWTGTGLPRSALKGNIECWEIIFGPQWADYLNAALTARDAGEQADVVIQRIALVNADDRHCWQSIAGLCRGAGLVRTSDEAMAKYRAAYRQPPPPQESRPEHG